MTSAPAGLDSPPDAENLPVAEELVQAALRAAEKRGKDVADVPVLAIAREAGISRSTLLRRLGGTRAALDEAVRAAGVDPGGQVPVRTRALTAAAALIGESGLAAVTLEAIATRADCAVHSLYMAFGSRDELLRIVFERHSPVPDLEDVLDVATDDLAATVHSLYQALAAALGREPRVGPAILAEVFARPASPAVQSLTQHAAPRMLDVLGSWMNVQVREGRIRDLPVPLLIQQLMGPMVMHMLFRPALSTVAVVEMPDLHTVCTQFAGNFVRAMAVD